MATRLRRNFKEIKNMTPDSVAANSNTATSPSRRGVSSNQRAGRSQKDRLTVFFCKKNLVISFSFSIFVADNWKKDFC
jgi:hypothetical protein